jgi:hypothetical protein
VQMWPGRGGPRPGSGYRVRTMTSDGARATDQLPRTFVRAFLADPRHGAEMAVLYALFVVELAVALTFVRLWWITRPAPTTA